MSLIKPDPECKFCKGKGVMEENGFKRECICLFKQKVLKYLTPLYADAEYDHSFDIEKYNTNLCFEKHAINKFRGDVKSFLLNNALQLTHNTFQASDIGDICFQNSRKEKDYPKLFTVDLVVLLLIRKDLNNKEYQNFIPHLIGGRLDRKKITWIYSDMILRSDKESDLDEFKRMYGGGTHQMINENFNFRKKQ